MMSKVGHDSEESLRNDTQHCFLDPPLYCLDWFRLQQSQYEGHCHLQDNDIGTPILLVSRCKHNATLS